MAEDAVWCELSSVKFPANREKYREYCDFKRNTKAVSAYWWVL